MGDERQCWVYDRYASILVLVRIIAARRIAWASANFIGANWRGTTLSPTNGANFYLTGVKLEIGSVATPFNRQSLAKSMADCQRYYQLDRFQHVTLTMTRDVS